MEDTKYLMGNCCRCYYFTSNEYIVNEDGSREYPLDWGRCHRYPQEVNVSEQHYCGEYYRREQ